MATEADSETTDTQSEQKKNAAEERRSSAAQDPDLPPPPENAKTFLRGQWLDLPPKKLMEIVAYTNCANWTGNMDWCAGGTKLSKPLSAVTRGFCDNIVLRCLVPPDQIKLKKDGDSRTQEYTYFGERCKKIREIVANWGIEIPADFVTGARLFAVDKQPPNSVGRRIPEPACIDSDTVIGRGKDAPAVPDNEWYWQHFKVTLCDANLQTVIDMVRSGDFAKHGLWLNDFDITIDCAGVVRVVDLIPWLLKHGGGFWMDGKKLKANKEDWDSDGRPIKETSKKIMDNAHKVGHNCITWMQKCNGLVVRVKAYIKLVQEFEKQSVRSTVGNHIPDWAEMSGTLLAHARDVTSEFGLMRSETTIYTDCDNIPIHKAHLHIPKTDELMTAFAELQISVIPEELVLKAPHQLMVSNWCANINHTLVVVDLYYDMALVCYAKNEVTQTVSGVYVNGWHRRGKYVLQKLMLGELPVDVIYMSRGSKHEAIQQEIPGDDNSSKRLKTAAKAKLSKAEKKRAMEEDATFLWVDADADIGNNQKSIKECLSNAGDKRKLAEDSDSEAEEDFDYAEEEDDAETEELDAEEEELDAEAQVAKAVAAERARMEAELAAAQAAAQADTTSTLDPGDSMRVAVDPGALVAFAQRYHRVTIKAEDDCITEFPPNGGLEHSFRLPADHPKMPELLPIDSEATTKEQKQKNKENKATNLERVTSATRAVLDQQLKLAGFKSTEENGMNTIVVHPRVGDAPPVSNKVKFAWLVDANSTIELDMNAIAGAQKRSSFALKPTTRKTRKLKLLKQRQDDRLRDLATAMEERPEIVKQKRKTTESVELKVHLRSLYESRDGQSLLSLNPGEYPIVAVHVLMPKEADDAKPMDKRYNLFLVVGQTEDGRNKVEPFKWTDAINKGFNANALNLAPLYNTLGDDKNDRPRHGVYYLSPDNTLTAIGTFTKTETMLASSNGRRHVDCGIVIGDHVVLHTAAQQRELHASKAKETTEDMEVDSVAENAPPPLLITDELKRSSGYLSQTFPIRKGDPARTLTVCKMGETTYYGHGGKIMLEVKEESSGKTAIVWGGVTINDRKTDITKDCKLIVHKYLQRNAMNVNIVASDAIDAFVYTLPKYSEIPAIRKGVFDGQPALITIAAVGSVKVDKVDNPVIQDSDGKAWRFAAPQNIKPNKGKNQAGLKLRKGAVLDTIKMAIVADV